MSPPLPFTVNVVELIVACDVIVVVVVIGYAPSISTNMNTAGIVVAAALKAETFKMCFVSEDTFPPC